MCQLGGQSIIFDTLSLITKWESNMSDLWLGLANKIINSWRAEWDKYPFGSRAGDKVVDALVEIGRAHV